MVNLKENQQTWNKYIFSLKWYYRLPDLQTPHSESSLIYRVVQVKFESFQRQKGNIIVKCCTFKPFQRQRKQFSNKCKSRLKRERLWLFASKLSARASWTRAPVLLAIAIRVSRSFFLQFQKVLIDWLQLQVNMYIKSTYESLKIYLKKKKTIKNQKLPHAAFINLS